MAAWSVMAYCMETTAGMPRRASTAPVLEKMLFSLALAPSQALTTARRREGWASKSRASWVADRKLLPPPTSSTRAIRPSPKAGSKRRDR